MRYRAAIRFAVEGDLRFISHHDTMRLFERAIARAGLPVRFSEGFNPRPRFSLPLPRAVGVATQADVLVIELSEPGDPADLLARLSSQMPGGLRLQSARMLEAGGSLQPVTVTYECPIDADQTGRVQQKIAGLLRASQWKVVRDSNLGSQDGGVDLRPLLVDAGIRQDRLLWTVRVTNAGSVRPAELLSAVGLDGRGLLHRVCRVDVEWSQARPSSTDLLTAGHTAEA